MAKRTLFAALLLLTFACASLAGAAEVLWTDLCADDGCSGAESGPCASCPCCPSHALVTVQPVIGPATGTAADFAVPAPVRLSSTPRGVLHVPKSA